MKRLNMDDDVDFSVNTAVVFILLMFAVIPNTSYNVIFMGILCLIGSLLTCYVGNTAIGIVSALFVRLTYMITSKEWVVPIVFVLTVLVPFLYFNIRDIKAESKC